MVYPPFVRWYLIDVVKILLFCKGSCSDARYVNIHFDWVILKVACQLKKNVGTRAFEE